MINVLIGSTEASVINRNHNALSTYGIVKDFDKRQLKTLMYELVQMGYISQSDDQYAVVGLTPKSAEVLKGKRVVMLTKPPVVEKVGKRQKAMIGTLAEGEDTVCRRILCLPIRA